MAKPTTSELPIFCDVIDLTKYEGEGNCIGKALIYSTKWTLRHKNKTLCFKKETLCKDNMLALDGKTFKIESLDIHRRHKKNFIFVEDVNEIYSY